MRGDIAVVGDSESVIGFKAAGFKTFAVKTNMEAAAAVEKLVNENCFVIFITEQVLEGVETILETYMDRAMPAIIPIPGMFGKTGRGMDNLEKNVERALGTNILNQR